MIGQPGFSVVGNNIMFDEEVFIKHQKLAGMNRTQHFRSLSKIRQRIKQARLGEN